MKQTSWAAYVLSLQLSYWKSAPNSKSLTSIYVKFFGQEVAFVDFDKNWFDNTFNVRFKQTTHQPKDQFNHDFARRNIYKTFFPCSSSLPITMLRRLVEMFSRLCSLVLLCALLSLCWLMR